MDVLIVKFAMIFSFRSDNKMASWHVKGGETHTHTCVRALVCVCVCDSVSRPVSLSRSLSLFLYRILLLVSIIWPYLPLIVFLRQPLFITSYRCIFIFSFPNLHLPFPLLLAYRDLPVMYKQHAQISRYGDQPTVCLSSIHPIIRRNICFSLSLFGLRLT